MNQVSQAQFGMIPLQFIETDPKQPRRTFDETALQELADSIKVSGVIQPILLRTIEDSATRLQLVAGERRYRASQLAGLDEIPGIVRQLTDAEVAIIQLVENHQRAGVPPLEEAEAMDRAMRDHGLKIEAICEEMGVKKRWAYTRLQLLKLSPEVRPALADGRVSASTALLIATIPSHKIQERATAEILRNNGYSEPMSYRSAKQLIEDRYMLRFNKAFFSLDDAKLVKSAGACTNCPKRTINSPDIYGEISADVCTDADCFDGKNTAFNEAVLSNARKKQLPVFEDWSNCKKELGDDLSTGFKAAHSFNRVVVEDIYKPVEELLSVKEMPQAVGVYKDHNGQMRPVFFMSAIQASLEKAGLARTEEEEQKIQTAAPLEDVPSATAEDLGKIRRFIIADAYNNLHREIFEEVKDRVSPKLLLFIYREMALVTAIAGANCLQLSFSTAAQDSYDVDLGDRPLLAAMLNNASDEDICRVYLDALFSELPTVHYSDIEDSRLNVENLNDDDEPPLIPVLLTIAERCGVDLLELRLKHLAITHDTAYDPREALLREGWNAIEDEENPYGWNDPRQAYWDTGYGWRQALGDDATFPALDANFRRVEPTEPSPGALATTPKDSVSMADGEELAEQAAEQEAAPKPAKKRAPKKTPTEAWPFPTEAAIAARKAEAASKGGAKEEA